MDQKINIQLSGDTLKIEERKGTLPELPPIPKPAKFSFAGTLSSVFLFLLHREALIDKAVAVITVNRRKLSITAQIHPNIEHGDVVKGEIALNPDLVAFQINKVGNNFSREKLLGFLRSNRQFFPDKEAHGQLMSTITNLKFNSSIESSKNEDNRGNKGADYQKTVYASDIPVSTIIEIPVFVGERPVRLSLDICFDTSEQNIYFWFESPELNEIIYNEATGRIQVEVDKIKEKGFLVIEE